MRDFDQAWSNLKSVYAITRFIVYPVNYVPDRYFHLASQREDLTWMIQVEELFPAYPGQPDELAGASGPLERHGITTSRSGAMVRRHT